MESILASVHEYIVREESVNHVTECLVIKGFIVESVKVKSLNIKDNLNELPSHEDLIRDGIEAMGIGQTVFQGIVAHKFLILRANTNLGVTIKHHNVPVITLAVPDTLAQGDVIDKYAGRCNLMGNQFPEVDQAL